MTKPGGGGGRDGETAVKEIKKERKRAGGKRKRKMMWERERERERVKEQLVLHFLSVSPGVL